MKNKKVNPFLLQREMMSKIKSLPKEKQVELTRILFASLDLLHSGADKLYVREVKSDERN